MLDLLNQAADLLNPLYNLLNLCCALDYQYSSFDHTSLIGYLIKGPLNPATCAICEIVLCRLS